MVVLFYMYFYLYVNKSNDFVNSILKYLSAGHDYIAHSMINSLVSPTIVGIR